MANQNAPKPVKRNPCLDEKSTIKGIPGEMVNERYLQNLPLMRAKINEGRKQERLAEKEIRKYIIK